MDRVKRVLTLLGLLVAGAGLAAAGVTLVQRLGDERQYRALLAQGEQALDAGNAYGAIEAFSGALAIRPGSMVAYYRRGEAYRVQNQPAEAVSNLREAARLAPQAPEPLIALGDLYSAAGDDTQAATWYGAAADRLKDEDPLLLYRLALARYRAGMPATAVAPLQEAIERRDSFAEAHYLLGLVYRDVRNFDAATASLEQALRIDPGLIAAREELADLHRTQGRTVDEMQQLQSLAARDSQVTRRVAIALAEARYGQYDGALRTLSDAQAAAPADSRVQVALGRVHLARAERTRDRESISRAMIILERALGGTVRRSEGLALYGRALALSGDLAGAERLLRDAVATSPVDLEAFQYLADVAERLSHDLVARDALVNLDVLQGDTADASVRANRARRIGALSLRAGDPKTSATYLNRAVDAGHADPATLGELARARWLSGDAAAARAVLARAMQAAPRDAELQRIARMIK